MDDYDSIPSVPQPTRLRVELFKHQLASIYQMEQLEQEQIIDTPSGFKETRLGINADTTGYGKCFSFGTKMLMYDGTIKEVQDIVVGDLLMGDDSTHRRVLSLARGQEDMYTIHQNTGGNDYTVNESHILSLKMTQPKRIVKRATRIQVFYFVPEDCMFRSKSFSFSSYEDGAAGALVDAHDFYNSLYVDPRVDIELRDYMQLSESMRRDLKGYRVGVDFPEQDVLMEPYMVGLWLGDGSSGTSAITTTDPEIVAYLRTQFTDYDIRVTKKITYHLSPKVNKGGKGSNSIINALREYNLMNNKHIPREYLINSRANRLSLLAGIIDSDGYYQRGVYEITQKRKTLSEHIVFLSRSLGFRTQLKKTRKSCMYKGVKREGVYYRISISGSAIQDIPVLLKRKRACTAPNKDQQCTGITVTPIGVGKYYGFSIDGNRRFLLDDFTVVHNTLSMIGLIARDKMIWDMDVPFVQENITTESAGLVRNREIKRYDKLPTTLILVSPSIVSQWEKELSQTDLRVGVVSSRRDVDATEVENYDVVIVTTSMYNNLVMSYAKYAWKRFIFDEPGHVRVSGMKELKAGFHWFVTATPEAITLQHRNCRGSFMKKIIGDGWTKFEEQFAGMILKNDVKFVQASFEMPPTQHHHHTCFQPILRAVSGLVTNAVHTMIAAGNIDGAISALGGKKTKNIIELVRQEKLEEQAKVEADIHIYQHIKKDENKLRIALEQEERISTQLEQLDTRFHTLLKENCSVCLETIKDPVLETKCQNLFCGKCLLTWLQKAEKCPLCRAPVDTAELVYLDHNEETEDSPSAAPVKKQFSPLEKVVDLVLNAKDSKFLIFSSYNATFEPICRILKENDIPYALVKGTQSRRKKSIHDFKYGKTKVIFLNSSFNGAGINLQEATDIILYHEMTSSTENQIIGRANRIGRTQPLHVHHLQVHI